METVNPATTIGRQFVQHYYTLLNGEPAELHRFYLDNSIYVHACETGKDDSVTGQQAIYERIVQLNFVNCCTRIRQVDAFPTVGDSIVIQVVGEISNNQEPLRPFVQTFVLVPHGANNFFVQNDVFRYQDHIVEPAAGENVQDGALGTARDADESAAMAGEQEPVAAQSTMYPYGDMTNGPPAVVDVPDVSLGTDDSAAGPPSPAQASLLSSTEPEAAVSHEPAPPLESDVSSGFAQEVAKEPETKGCSWANVAGGKKSSHPPAQVPPVRAPSPSPLAAANALPQRQVRRNPAAEATAARPAQSNGRPVSRGRDMPDSHQLFIGNLPNHVEADDVKKAFSPHGHVVDVIIKNTPKNIICFVIFDNADDVSRILNEKYQVNVQGVTLHIDKKKASSERRGFGPAGRGGRGGGMSDRGRGTGRSRRGL